MGHTESHVPEQLSTHTAPSRRQGSWIPEGLGCPQNARGQYYRGEMGPQVFLTSIWMSSRKRLSEREVWIVSSGLIPKDLQRARDLNKHREAFGWPSAFGKFVNRASVTICA